MWVTGYANHVQAGVSRINEVKPHVKQHVSETAPTARIYFLLRMPRQTNYALSVIVPALPDVFTASVVVRIPAVVLPVRLVVSRRARAQPNVWIIHLAAAQVRTKLHQARQQRTSCVKLATNTVLLGAITKTAATKILVRAYPALLATSSRALVRTNAFVAPNALLVSSRAHQAKQPHDRFA